MSIKAEKQVYMLEGNKSQQIWAMAYDYDGYYFPVLYGVRYDGYDKNVIRIVGSRIYPVHPGETRVQIHWHDFSGDFIVRVS